jgi:cysteine desulfurase
VLDPCAALAAEGFEVDVLPVQSDGRLDLERLRRALVRPALLVSVMHANNEIGVIQPIAELAALARAHGALFHCDAAQSVGKIPVDVSAFGVDLLSATAHKLYGPTGIGALFARRREPRLSLEPLVHGGGHERGLRSGTLAVPLAVGFGAACEIAEASRASESARVLALRELLWQRLAAESDVWLNGHATERLPGNLNVSFGGVEGEALLMALPDIALSTGSACTSASPRPSHVLRALGTGDARALSSLRFGIGRTNTREEIERAATRVVAELRRLRALSPVWERRRRSALHERRT